MRIACVSASNTRQMGEYSTSTKVCRLIEKMILEDSQGNITVDMVPLMDYDIKPCVLCGDCSKTGSCVYDGEFNRLLSKLAAADGIFVVVPHYSPIPSKLLMLFEKMNEIIYAGWLNDPEYRPAFGNKTVGIIGHGGMAESEENLRYYHDRLVTPVADTLKSLSFNVIGQDESFSNGAVFGLKDSSCLKKVEDSVFPEIIQDWPTIGERIKPLVANVMRELGALKSL